MLKNAGYFLQVTPTKEMEDLVLCHACKKSAPTMVSTFDLFLPENAETQQWTHQALAQTHGNDKSFSGHMEMYYFTADDEPVTIMQTHLDMSGVGHCVVSLIMNLFKGKQKRNDWSSCWRCRLCFCVPCFPFRDLNFFRLNLSSQSPQKPEPTGNQEHSQDTTGAADNVLVPAPCTDALRLAPQLQRRPLPVGGACAAAPVTEALKPASDRPPAQHSGAFNAAEPSRNNTNRDHLMLQRVARELVTCPQDLDSFGVHLGFFQGEIQRTKANHLNNIEGAAWTLACQWWDETVGLRPTKLEVQKRFTYSQNKCLNKRTGVCRCVSWCVSFFNVP